MELETCVCKSASLCDMGKDFFLLISVSPHLVLGTFKVSRQWLRIKPSLSIIKNLLRIYTYKILNYKWYGSYPQAKSMKNLNFEPWFGRRYGPLSKKNNSATRSNFYTTYSLSPFLKHCWRDSCLVHSSDSWRPLLFTVLLHLTQALSCPSSSDAPHKTPVLDLVLRAHSYYPSILPLNSASQRPKRTGLIVSTLLEM